METKYGFTKFTLIEFENWLKNLRVARTILFIQQHHTYVPSYVHFNGSNHFDLQRSMKNSHLDRGFEDIAQHFTTFPDGTIVTGRLMEKTPAGIKGFNSAAICIENLGYFDSGFDVMTKEQKDTIVAITAILCKRYNILPTTDSIVYHHWFDLDTGARTNGRGNTKSCPGTAFFKGNKVEDAKKNFIPLVKKQIDGTISTDTSAVLKYVAVTAETLNIRTGPSSTNPKASDRQAANFGAVLRVYAITDGWYKISNSKEHWVAARFTQDVLRAVVSANTLNVRSGPSAAYPKISSYIKGTEVFVLKQENGWSQVNYEPAWVKDEYLDFG